MRVYSGIQDVSKHFTLISEQSLLVVNSSIPENIRKSKINIQYSVFPFDLSKEYKNKDKSWYTVITTEPENPFLYSPGRTGVNLLELNSLNKSGSISRGISFGNNQDVVVNSNFNLQLSGNLSREVSIVAAITDNNIPIQPEGNTQQIQEFDKVFIQLSARNNTLTVGDYELHRPDSYFMNFLKKAQGADFQTQFDLKKSKNKGSMKIETAAALSKGKFARNKFQGIEGNQGPYKLFGNEGETYIIVLAGTEKVYIDGRLMKRGEAFDYTIDYNKGEVSFTPNVIITKDKRIVVEFEYSDKNYARALFYVNNEYKNERLHLRFNAYSESDLKNQTLQEKLSPEEKDILRNVGDSIQDAIIWNIDSAGVSMDEVRYRLTDTIVNGINYDSILVYSTDPDSAIYKAGFSNVGSEKGDYKLVKSDANGRVFQWFAPVNGAKQGSYEPIKLLISPKKTQMLTLGADYKLGSNTNLSSEIALSNDNINTFSDKDRGNDLGIALHLKADHTFILSDTDSSGWNIVLGGFLDHTGKDFKPIEPFRPIEFQRDWNITRDIKAMENLGGLSLEAIHHKSGFIKYEFQTLLKEDLFKGYKNLISSKLENNKYLLEFDGSFLSASDQNTSSQFLRHKAHLSRKFKWFMIGLKDDQEHNIFNDNKSDSLMLNSYSFFEYEAYIKTIDSTGNQFELFYNNRIDKLPFNNNLKKATRAEEFGATSKLEKNRNNRLTLSVVYRKLHIDDTAFANAEPEENIIGRIEHFLRIKKGLITANTYYEVGSGLEEKKEFSYLKVPTGEGIYVWVDYNGDGIQQLNEFEIAPFKDQADYIRIFTPSNEYTKTYNNQFSETFMINPAAIWSQKEGFKKFVSRFSDQLAFRIEHKTSEEDHQKAYNPFISEKAFNDSLLVTLGSNFRNTFYFNRNNPIFGIDWTIQNNKSKTFLVNGFETRTLKQNALNLRWNFYKAFSVIFTGNYGEKSNFSQFFTSRDYRIIFYTLTPSLSYQPGTDLRIDLNYSYNNKSNNYQNAGELALKHDIGAEVNYKVLNKGSLLLDVNYIIIDYNNSTNTPLAFEMLEGFQSGKNGTWSISFQYNLAKYLQLNLSYTGRKSPDIKTVHIGSAQLRAYF